MGGFLVAEWKGSWEPDVDVVRATGIGSGGIRGRNSVILGIDPIPGDPTLYVAGVWHTHPLAQDVTPSGGDLAMVLQTLDWNAACGYDVPTAALLILTAGDEGWSEGPVYAYAVSRGDDGRGTRLETARWSLAPAGH